MSKLGTLFRTCPSCGHKFHVELVNERLLSDNKSTEPVGRAREDLISAGPMGGFWVYLRGRPYSPPLGAQEKETLAIERIELEDSFKCGRCGHQWSEKRTKENERT